MWFKRSPIRMHPGEQRTITILADPAQIPRGTPIEVEADGGLTLTLRTDTLPGPGARGLSAVAGSLRARVTVEPGSQLSCDRRLRRSHGRAGSDHRPPPRLRLGERDRPQRRGPADRSRVRPRNRNGHRLRGPPRVPRAPTRRSRRLHQEAHRRIRPVPDARGRSRRQRRLRLGRRTDPRPAPPLRTPNGPRRLRRRNPPRTASAAPPHPPQAHASIPRARIYEGSVTLRKPTSSNRTPQLRIVDDWSRRKARLGSRSRCRRGRSRLGVIA